MPEDPVEAALQAPPSPDYVPGPEEPEQAPPSPDYVPGPEHADDEIVAKDQPYAKDASPTAQSPDYVPKSNPEANPEEDDDEDLEEDPVNYLVMEEMTESSGEPSEEDMIDDVDLEADELADRPQSCGGRLSRSRGLTKVADFSPIFTPPSITTLTMVFTTFPRIHSPPYPCFTSPSLPLSPPSLVLSPSPPPSPIRSLGYRAAMIQLRAEATSTSHSLPLPPPFILSPTRSNALSSGIPPPLPISVPTSSPPLLLPSTSRREDKFEVTLPPRKRLGIALGPRYKVGESSSAVAARSAGGLRADYGFVATMDREIRRDPERDVGYGITDSLDEIVETLQGAPISTYTELGRHMIAFETRVRQDTDEIYTRLDDEQKARLSRVAWRRLMDASDLAHGEVMSIRTTVLGQMSEIRELHAADRKRQAVTSEMLKADHRRFAEIRELRTTDCTRQQQLIQTFTGQQGPAGGPAQPELPEEAGSSS
ncbi:hypothetical protein Tco_0527448 [Tanacetum coccineum]